ncbi:Hypothetical Protein FCC1311_076902 [Hondaea fermentalgiana]|uniref:Uncharacterized protein n=1 Tax=Hondaea fermentalgiana TaxID=2315210 RepID=A0A2R5GKM8_9STRA|nr:Hypothetical Protein FCC1311_076902 [Hondaea fermentalgiana]|eukprot:GBG31466.1 Hypothetical Protein FCC1311_076902 [Hondaea fermentalgiana]
MAEDIDVLHCNASSSERCDEAPGNCKTERNQVFGSIIATRINGCEHSICNHVLIMDCKGLLNDLHNAETCALADYGEVSALETESSGGNLDNGFYLLAVRSFQDCSLGISTSTSSLQLGKDAAAVTEATSQWLQARGDLLSPSSNGGLPGSPRVKPSRSLYTRDDTSWLNDVRKDLHDSVEWQALTRQMYLHVQRALEKTKVLYYGDLSADEKALMLDDIEETISEGDIFRSFEKALAEKIDNGITNRLTARSAETAALSSRPEAMVELAAYGVSEMLSLVPSKISAMRMLINRQLPSTLRLQVWDVYLRDTEALEAFRNRVSVRRMATIASTDTEVTERCQHIFQTEFPEIADSSTLIMLGKTVLSYRASAFGRVDDAQFYWLVPILVVFAKSYNDLPRVVEAMHAVTVLSKPQVSSAEGASAQHSLGRVKFADDLDRTLSDRDTDLHTHLLRIVKSEAESDPVAGLARSPQSRLLDILAHSIDHLFVGTLHIETCLFVWDQCLIVGFQRLAIPLACSILLLLRDQLLDQSSLTGIRDVISHQAKGISVKQLARIMESEFWPELRAELGYGKTSASVSHWTKDPLKRLAVAPSSETLDDLSHTEERKDQNEVEKLVDAAATKARLEARAVALNAALNDDRGDGKDKGEPDNTGSAKAISPEKNETLASPRAKRMANLPMVNLRVNAFADALKRAKDLNPDISEESLRTELVEAVPEFAAQDPSAPVLRSKVGKAICYFRALKKDESADLAKDIVTCELERVNEPVSDGQVDKLVKHLLHFSKARAGFRKGVASNRANNEEADAADQNDSFSSSLRDEDVKDLDAIVSKMAGALLALQTGNFLGDAAGQ